MSDVIIRADQVKVRDSVRFCLKDYFFGDDQKWRKHCERTLLVKSIEPCTCYRGRTDMLEFHFADDAGTYHQVHPTTEVILVHRPSGKSVGKMFYEAAKAAEVFLTEGTEGSIEVLDELIRTYLLSRPAKTSGTIGTDPEAIADTDGDHIEMAEAERKRR